MTTSNDKIRRIEARIEKAKMQKKREEQKVKQQLKKKETRRKILTGWILEELEKAGNVKAGFIQSQADKRLTRAADRELFGLDPLNHNQEQNHGA